MVYWLGSGPFKAGDGVRFPVGAHPEVTRKPKSHPGGGKMGPLDGA